MVIKIKKGHNIRISGLPAGSIESAPRPDLVGIVPADFTSIKPKLLVKPGDKIKLGEALFFDKNNPRVKYPAPGGGVIKDVVYGERRSIRKIIIDLDSSEAVTSLDAPALETAGREDVVDFILNSNLWPLLSQRPFGKNANPDDTPRAIFVSGHNSAPLTADLSVALEGREEAFKTGMNVLKKLSGGEVNLTVEAGTSIPAFTDLDGISVHEISGPHPAGNVGIQIHHIAPLKPGEVVWTIAAQQVVTLGRLFLTGSFDPTVVVAVGGPAAEKPCYLKTRIGTDITTLVVDQPTVDECRIISGDVLTGRKADAVDFLGFYHSSIALLPVSHERPFVGWARIGSSRKQYTLTNAFLKTGKQAFDFSTKINGGRRAVVPINAWEDVIPMDIVPNALFRSILAQDVEEMEKLGIIECHPEDFALATFACPSKIELSAVIRQGLDIIEKEI